MKIIKTNSAGKIDRKTFNFYFPKDFENISPIVPCVKLDNTVYVIANFNSMVDEMLLFDDVCNYTDALNLSVKMQGKKLNIFDLSNIYSFILNKNLNVNDFSFFREYNIVSNKQFHILKRFQYLPDNLKIYIAEKDIPFRYLNILVNFEERIIKKISVYIDKNRLSVSNFRILINNVYDFKDEIDFENDLDSEISRLRNEFNKRRFDFEKKINDLLQIDNDISMENQNNFEDCSISISFKIKSFEDFLAKIETLKKSEKNIKEVFDILRNNDLC